MKKKIVFDMVLNILATTIPTIILQLGILPFLGYKMQDSDYGLLLTILAMLNVVPATIGNAINNIRLLHEKKYQKMGYQGDFIILIVIAGVMDVVIMVTFLLIYDDGLTMSGLLLTITVSLLWMVRTYCSVAFRLIINYKKIIVSNLFMAIGYLIGLIFYIIWIPAWQIIYIVGNFSCIIYTLHNSKLFWEPIKITPLFYKTLWQTVLLLISNILTRLMTYADKLLLFPLLGGATVATYYVATVFGKIVSIIITPVNSVVLTYISKLANKKNNIFKCGFTLGIVVCSIGYVTCIIISRPVLSILYPQYVDEAMRFVWITTGTTALYALITLVNPFMLKFFDMKWQIAINGGSIVVYVLLCLTFLSKWGLKGFCVGTFLTNLMKLIFMLVIYNRFKSLDE